MTNPYIWHKSCAVGPMQAIEWHSSYVLCRSLEATDAENRTKKTDSVAQNETEYL